MAASLAMYARPELLAETAAFWALIRGALRTEGVAAPKDLTEDGIGLAFWQRPDLVLSQTCGYPYRRFLKGRVTLIGTPDYGVPGCPPGYYRSVLVVGRTSALAAGRALDGAALAYNADDSQSGYHAALANAARHRIAVLPRLQTGAHRASAQAVAAGHAEVAAIDAVTWTLILRYDAFAAELRVIDHTDPVPGLPLIAAAGADRAATARAVSAAIAALPSPTRAALCLRRLVPLTDDAYTDAAFARPAA